ncbi:MAG: hypothetical protein KDA45_12810 [Planctomycetales bacterium]|nr:hypothetical protein [Planctomycetales bacterium]
MKQASFLQDCPVCGRPMRVRLELLGQRIRCGHCLADCDAVQALPPAFHALGQVPTVGRQRRAVNYGSQGRLSRT